MIDLDPSCLLLSKVDLISIQLQINEIGLRDNSRWVALGYTTEEALKSNNPIGHDDTFNTQRIYAQFTLSS